MQCPECGKDLPEGMRFCGYCGTPLPVLEREEERKLASVMFVDVVGFTRLSEQMDPEEVSDLLDRFYKVVNDVVRRHYGHVDKLIGDAALVLFGVPRALENPAYHAITAALDLRTQVRNLGIQIHTGIHTGEVLVTHMGEGVAVDYTVIGDTVNVAQRLESLAQSGEVLVSERTWNMVEGLFEGTPIGDLRVKGRQEPIRVWLVQKKGGQVLRRGLSQKAPLRGRDQEISQLREALAYPGDRLIALVADAGYGKSRLIGEVVKNVDLFLVASPERPAGGLFTPYVPEGIPRTVETMLQHIRPSLIHHPPRVIRIEDLHWADDLSLEVLERLLVFLPSPLTLLVTTRPDGEDALHRIQQAFKVREGRTFVIPLEGLSRQALEEMAQDLAPDLPQPLQDEFVDQAQGNPLFLEEMIRTWREEGHPHLPHRIEGLIQERVDRLPHDLKATLKKVSVLGIRFSENSLRLMDISQTDLAFQRLVSSGWLKPVREGWAFRNILVWESVYRMLLHKERRALHQKLLDALESQKVSPEVLAYHAVEAQDWDRALRYALQAAEHLLEIRAIRDAGRVVRWAEEALSYQVNPQAHQTFLFLKALWLRHVGEPTQALTLADELLKEIPKTHPLFWKIWFLKVEILMDTGRVEEARRVLESLSPPEEHRLEWLRWYASLRISQGDRLRELAEMLDPVVRENLRRQAWDRAEALMISLIEALRYGGDLDRALEIIQEAMAQIPEDREAIHAKLWHIYGEIQRLKGNLEEAHRAFERALAQIEKLGDRWLMGLLLLDYGRLLWTEGKTDFARQILERDLRVGQSLESFGIQFHTLINLARISLEKGHLGETYQNLRRARELVQANPNPRATGMVLHLQAAIRMLYEGVVEAEVENNLKEALEIARTSQEGEGIIQNALLLGWIALLKQKKDQAQLYFEEILHHRQALFPRIHTIIAWGLHVLGTPVPREISSYVAIPSSMDLEPLETFLRQVGTTHRALWRPAVWILVQKAGEGVIPLARSIAEEIHLPPFFLNNLPFTVRD